MVFGLEGPYATPYTAKPVADTCKLESSSCCGERVTGDIKTQFFLSAATFQSEHAITLQLSVQWEQDWTKAATLWKPGV